MGVDERGDFCISIYCKVVPQKTRAVPLTMIWHKNIFFIDKLYAWYQFRQ